MKLVRFSLGLWAAMLLPAQPALAGQEATAAATREQPVIERGVMVPMRDGVRLATTVFRPPGDGSHPVVLMRDPYGAGTDGPAGTREWVAHGYALVHQSVRGTGASEGHFYPYANEAHDGYDTLQWLSTQPWSNGKVGMKGGSYLGSVQWLGAHLRHPSLVAIAPLVSPFNYYRDVVYTGGALAFASRADWGLSRAGVSPDDENWPKLLRHLPLKTTDTTFGRKVPHWRDWLAHPSYDDYWRMFDVEARVSQIDLPALNIGGWYDTHLRSTLTAYTAMHAGARSERARRGQKLVVGPWEHSRKPQVGEFEFSAAATDLEALARRWFDHWLKGEDSGFMDEPPVRIFVMGDNRWRSEAEWPLARTRYTRYYLEGGGADGVGGAAGAGGVGRLVAERAAPRGTHWTYTYDPEDPVPTLGGNLMSRGLTAGPVEQGALSRRTDVLRFVTPVLTQDTEVTGPIQVTLYAASSASDTDFTAKLIDVHPDGKAYNLADGIIRARYRESFEHPSPIEPGRVYEYAIDLWATSNVFKRGHRIRVDISSSNFPRFDRNPNTGHAFGEDAELRPATQTIHFGGVHASYIILPIIP